MPGPPLFRGFSVILRHATLSRTPLICPTQRSLPDNSHIKRQTSLPSAGFEPAIPANGWPNNYAIDRVAPVIGIRNTKNQRTLRLRQILSTKLIEISVPYPSLWSIGRLVTVQWFSVIGLSSYLRDQSLMSGYFLRKVWWIMSWGQALLQVLQRLLDTQFLSINDAIESAVDRVDNKILIKKEQEG